MVYGFLADPVLVEDSLYGYQEFGNWLGELVFGDFFSFCLGLELLFRWSGIAKRSFAVVLAS